MSENKTSSLEGEDRGNAFIIMAMSFNIVGLGSLAFGNVPVAGGLLVASLAFMILSLFYSTKKYREKRKKQKETVPEQSENLA
jgi:Ca2+/Na+ antiporter